MMMQSARRGLLLATTALCLAQGPALAATCYFVYDRNDNLIYRDQQPPVDMSERGAASRDALRQRGEFLVFAESDRCAPLAFLTGPGTPGTLSVDQIVAGFPAMNASQGVAFDSAAPGQGVAPSARMVGVSRGGGGVMRAR